MSNVNWWLMGLAFVLGLVLTLALTIRRVKREVPVYEALGRGPGVQASGGAAKLAGGTAAAADEPTTTLPKVDEPTTRIPKPHVDEPTVAFPKAGAVAAGVAAAGAAAVAGGGKHESKDPDDSADGDDVPEVVEEAPFGAGSLRVSGKGTPAGYTVKGNEDSMLYHTAESPSYAQTIAEIWFRDVASAEAAGFNRWDSGKSQRGKK